MRKLWKGSRVRRPAPKSWGREEEERWGKHGWAHCSFCFLSQCLSNQRFTPEACKLFHDKLFCQKIIHVRKHWWAHTHTRTHTLKTSHKWHWGNAECDMSVKQLRVITNKVGSMPSDPGVPSRQATLRTTHPSIPQSPSVQSETIQIHTPLGKETLQLHFHQISQLCKWRIWIFLSVCVTRYNHLQPLCFQWSQAIWRLQGM